MFLDHKVEQEAIILQTGGKSLLRLMFVGISLIVQCGLKSNLLKLLLVLSEGECRSKARKALAGKGLGQEVVEGSRIIDCGRTRGN